MHALVEAYIDHGVDGGYFLNLIMDNDFAHAYQHADMENQTHLLGWIRFLCLFAPADCWGSPYAVNLWRQQGGLAGFSMSSSKTMRPTVVMLSGGSPRDVPADPELAETP